MRKMETLRNSIMRGCGTDESWFMEDAAEQEAETGRRSIAAHWRKPLRIDEVNLMTPTPEVRERPGRP